MTSELSMNRIETVIEFRQKLKSGKLVLVAGYRFLTDRSQKSWGMLAMTG